MNVIKILYGLTTIIIIFASAGLYLPEEQIKIRGEETEALRETLYGAIQPAVIILKCGEPIKEKYEPLDVLNRIYEEYLKILQKKEYFVIKDEYTYEENSFICSTRNNEEIRELQDYIFKNTFRNTLVKYLGEANKEMLVEDSTIFSNITKKIREIRAKLEEGAAIESSKGARNHIVENIFEKKEPLMTKYEKYYNKYPGMQKRLDDCKQDIKKVYLEISKGWTTKNKEGETIFKNINIRTLETELQNQILIILNDEGKILEIMKEDICDYTKYMLTY